MNKMIKLSNEKRILLSCLIGVVSPPVKNRYVLSIKTATSLKIHQNPFSIAFRNIKFYFNP